MKSKKLVEKEDHDAVYSSFIKVRATLTPVG